MSLKFTGNQTEKVYSAMLNNLAFANQNGVLTDCLVKASSPVAMTVDVEQGKIFFGNDTVDVTASTVSFNNNTTSYDRIDLVVVDNSGVVSVIEGTAQTVAMTPNYDPENYVVLAMVTLTSSITAINDTDIKDLRVLNQGGSSGGSGGGINRYKEDFTSQTQVVVTHNLGDNEPVVQVYDNNGEQIVPQSIDITSSNVVTIDFSTSTSGVIIVHGGLGGTSYYSESYTSSTTWNVVHNLGRKYVNVQCYDDNNNLIEPQNVELTDENNLVVTFGTATAGQVVISGGASDSNVDFLSINISSDNINSSVSNADFVYYNNNNSEWTTCNANITPVGVYDSSNNTVIYEGVANLFTGLVKGDFYYLNGGLLTNNYSSSAIKVGYAINDTTLIIDIDFDKGINIIQRALFAGGYDGSNYSNTIDYVTISTTGNATDFGDLTVAREGLAGASSSTRALFAGGYDGSNYYNTIDYVTISTTGNATDFGDLTVTRSHLAGASSSTRALFAGGKNGSTYYNTIDYVEIATTGNATDFGDLTIIRANLAGASSSTRALFAGGYKSSLLNTIDYVEIDTTGNATDFGDLTVAREYLTGASNSTRALFAGGYDSNSTYYNIIDYVTISTTGNATDFGDLTVARTSLAGASSSTRTLFAGGRNGSTYYNTIDYVTISTTGNATDFGDLTVTRTDIAGASNCHGGLQ